MKSPYFSMFCLHCTERRAHLDKTTILKIFSTDGGVVFFEKIDTPGERGDLEGGHGKGPLFTKFRISPTVRKYPYFS